MIPSYHTGAAPFPLVFGTQVFDIPVSFKQLDSQKNIDLRNKFELFSSHNFSLAIHRASPLWFLADSSEFSLIPLGDMAAQS
jgi:hypothetical protein